MYNFTFRSILILSLHFVTVSLCVSQQRPFITEWRTDNNGSTCDRCISIPTSDREEYNYTVDWGDGIVESGFIDDAFHEYDAIGNYIVSITGDFPSIMFGDTRRNTGDAEKLLWVHQWGDIEWASFSEAFFGCSNFNCDAEDTPDLSQVIDMSTMFAEATSFNHDIGDWDLSNIRFMRFMFLNASNFNQDIGGWDVSNVINLDGVFALASSFNQNIGGWDVSSALEFNFMFSAATSFDQDISDWDVSNASRMQAMFNSATSFNQDIGNWDVSGVSTMDRMFNTATSFNQDIGDWDVSNVMSMSSMFREASLFNQDIGSWNVSLVEKMDFMFFMASSFNQDIAEWDVSKVDDMLGTFASATDFNQDIGTWDVSNVTDMNGMFAGASSFNQNLEQWNVSQVTNMSLMFIAAPIFNQNIGSWDVSSVFDMTSMFAGAISFNQDIGNWDVSNVDDMNAMFFNASSFDQDLGTWDIRSVTDMVAMFDTSGMSVASYDATLIGWDSNGTAMNNIILGAATLEFCESSEARDRLINEKGWTFEGDVQSEDASCNTTAVENVIRFPITISPNPFSDHINIEYDPEFNIQIELYSQEGKLVQKQLDSSFLNTSELSAGQYILQLTDKATGNRRVEKLVLIR